MKIEIKSGFQRGGTLWRWDGDKFTVVNRAGECTWHDDDDTSFSVELPSDFRGVVTRFWGAGHSTRIGHIEFIGFSEAELGAPAPVVGLVIVSGFRTCETHPVKTFADWAAATLVVGCRFIPASEAFKHARAAGKQHPVSGNWAVQNGFEWGDQRARGYDVWSSDGSYLFSVEGCGDGTPSLNQGELDWEFPTPRDEAWEAEQIEAEARAEEWEQVCLEAEKACEK